MSTPLFKQFSGLRFKVLSALSAAFLVLFLGQFTAARIILLNGYAKLGEEKTRMSAEQVQNALSQELGQIDAIATDWAEWDDTYQFVEDGNKAYIASNLVNDTFKDLNLNVLLIANNSGQIVFGQAFDLQRQQRRDFPPELVGLLSQKKSPLLPHSLGEKRINGILLLSEKAILLSAHSILTSAEQGPVRGTLIMGRFLNEAEIKKLAATTKLLLGAYRYHDSQLPTDVSSILTRLSQKNPIAVQILDDSSIVGYVLLEDILGQPALILRTEMEQNIYAQGQAILSYYFSTTLAIAIVFYMLISILLEKLVLSRVSQLTQGVSTIGKTVLMQNWNSLPTSPPMTYKNPCEK
jgi:sensor domain CHASE-containing protein